MEKFNPDFVKKIIQLKSDIFKPLEIYLKCITKKCNQCVTKSEGIFEFPEKTKRVITIGDIHGDFESLLMCLLKANVINDQLEWIGEDTIVVQMGDILDRGGRPNSIDTDNNCEELHIIQFLEFLNKKAQNFNGKVLCLLGNHELMNILGDFRYTSSNTNKCFANRKEIFKPGSEMAKKLSCLTYGILKISDWVFVHGGILPIHIRSYQNNPNKFIEKMNKLTKSILDGTKDINALTTYEKNLIMGEDSLFWTRELNNNCKLVNESIEILNLEKGGIVVGHTPNDSITSKCNERYWMVDIAMSGAFGNRKKEDIEVLQITKNNDDYNTHVIT